MNYKKPKFWVIIFAVAIVAVAGIGLITNPAAKEPDLSMLNIKNLAILSYQRDHLLVSGLPGKSESFNVSARAIAEYLDSVEWIQMKLNSSPEYSPSLKIEWNEDQEIIFYETDTPIAIVRLSDKWRCYRVGQKDYETLLLLIEKNIVPIDIGAESELKEKIESFYHQLSGQEIKLPDFQYDGNDPVEKLVYATEMEMYSMPDRGFTVVAAKIFGSYEEKDRLKVFVTTDSATYKLYGNVLKMECGSVVPAAITYKKGSDGSYQLENYVQAQDGAYFAPSIKEFCRMPVSGRKIRGLADKMIKGYTDREDLINQHWKNLYKHLKTHGIEDATLYYPDGEIEFTMSDPKYGY